MESISRYAETIGVEYRQVSGHPVHPKLSTEIQKAFIFDEGLDEYDTVLGLDCDVFAKTDEGVFSVSGVGLLHPELPLPGKARRAGVQVVRGYPYFNGGFLKLDRALRQALRSHLTAKLLRGCHTREAGGVEMLTYALCVHAGLKPPGVDPKWNYYAHLPHPETAKMIHIRRGGPGKPAILKDLRSRGILA